jgi:hypothetical protein
VCVILKIIFVQHFKTSTDIYFSHLKVQVKLVVLMVAYQKVDWRRVDKMQEWVHIDNVQLVWKSWPTSVEIA